MKIYVGITDWNWYHYLSDNAFTEVNFWKPSGQPFKALSEGDLFLFKLKAAQGGKIAGGGYFVSATTMPVDWAWKAFGNENGVVNLAQLSDAIEKYRSRNNVRPGNPNIGCIALTDVVFFEQAEWFDAPGNWRSIVSGKTFETDKPEGRALYEQAMIRMMGQDLRDVHIDTVSGDAVTGENRYSVSPTKHRLGQGSFRMLVADAYNRRCAISGEKTLPVLQAAHIRPYSEDGPHQVTNGLLLRSDIHTLFDAGYITVSPDYRVHVSKRINEDYGNGKIYYAYQGQPLTVLPDDKPMRPLSEYLTWHNDCVYMG